MHGKCAEGKTSGDRQHAHSREEVGHAAMPLGA
jgi:hypothetical protein